MAQYRNEDQSLTGLARQLADAFGEAQTPEDEDHACEAIAGFLDEYGEDAPSAALIALLDLESTDQTFALVDRAKTLLSERGPAVVELLLAATLGRVYDRDGQTPENALGTLDSMEEIDLIQGLCEVLSGGADDDLKGVAVDGLVALGDSVAAADGVWEALKDPVAEPWARAVLEQLGQDVSYEAGIEAEDGAVDEDAPGDDAPEDDPEGASIEGTAPDGGDAGSAGAPAGEAVPALPDREAVDQSYESFLRRFEGREDGGGSQA